MFIHVHSRLPSVIINMNPVNKNIFFVQADQVYFPVCDVIVKDLYSNSQMSDYYAPCKF